MKKFCFITIKSFTKSMKERRLIKRVLSAIFWRILTLPTLILSQTQTNERMISNQLSSIPILNYALIKSINQILVFVSDSFVSIIFYRNRLKQGCRIGSFMIVIIVYEPRQQILRIPLWYPYALLRTGNAMHNSK